MCHVTVTYASHRLNNPLNLKYTKEHHFCIFMRWLKFRIHETHHRKRSVLIHSWHHPPFSKALYCVSLYYARAWLPTMVVKRWGQGYQGSSRRELAKISYSLVMLDDSSLRNKKSRIYFIFQNTPRGNGSAGCWWHFFSLPDSCGGCFPWMKETSMSSVHYSLSHSN